MAANGNGNVPAPMVCNTAGRACRKRLPTCYMYNCIWHIVRIASGQSFDMPFLPSLKEDVVVAMKEYLMMSDDHAWGRVMKIQFTPEEIGLLLKAWDFNNDTRL
ncbi:hypothetical protein Tco_1059075 [Tanacetum coccineum]